MPLAESIVVVLLQITFNKIVFQANLYFLLEASLSSASHWYSKRPLALAPRCSAASKIITLKVGQRDFDFSALMCRCPDAELERSS